MIFDTKPISLCYNYLNTRGVYMMDRLIDEIYVNMNNNCFLTALSTALSIPDICGKAEYPNL